MKLTSYARYIHTWYMQPIQLQGLLYVLFHLDTIWSC